MTTKRILALLIAVLMLVSLFSACASNETKEPDSGSNGAGDDANTPDDTKTPSDDGGEEDDNTPIEKEPYKLTFMGSENHQWTYTYEEAKAKGFATIDYYNDKDA